jgi:sarcosine oxidase, subunit alpha
VTARLGFIAGEWIDRSRALSFEFEGRRYSGYAGDSVTSALWASGVRVLGRSFKYHRPRGVLSLAGHDVNALVEDGRSLNLRADVTPVEAGMRLSAVNTFGGLESDRARLLDRLSAFLPVGFYYKTFHRPKWAFPRWERLIRAISGLGRPDFAAPRVRTPKRYDFCDVLVIGAGPSGIAAALAAARAGAQVLLVDENARIGGSLSYARGARSDGLTLLQKMESAALAEPNIRLRTATFACGCYADHWVALVDAEKMTKVRARSVIMAGGVFEQPAVFRNNDLPGVMLASAAQRLIYRYAAKPMQRAVVLTANSEGYDAALDLLAAGVAVAAVVDLRHAGEESAAVEELRRREVPIHSASCIYEAFPVSGLAGVEGAAVCRLQRDGRADFTARQTLHCDGVVMSTGFAPADALLHQAGARMRFDDSLQQFVPDALPDGVFAAGRVNGVYDLAGRLQDGERAALQALRGLGYSPSAPVRAVPRETRCPSHPYPVIEHPRGKNFVDFDEDLQLKDFGHAAQEGFDNIELLKRYTTVGMGPSQGKHSNMNAARILARIRRQPVGEVGSTTARPFFHPVPLAHLAGRGFQPERRTPLHARHERAGAVFMQAGVWLRAEYYARGRQPKAELVAEEASSVRTGVGIIDVGTLGKLEVSGPGGGELLERTYTGRFRNLKAGMTRYALMLDESGVIVDDGVVARLSEERFYFTTTTTGAANVYREMQRLNAMWGLECGLVNLTGAMAAVNLAGPLSRRMLAPMTDIDLDDAAFPYLAVREGRIAGAPVRVLRVGFVGELGYEIHVPAGCAAGLWDALMQAGTPLGIRPFGVEAQRLLRLEKGHLIIGQDTDGLTTPFQAAVEWAVKMDKPFFVGQRSLRTVAQRPVKQRLAGFALVPDFTGLVPKECHLIIRDGGIAGRVTSVARSAALGRIIGLAMLPPEMTAVGTHFEIRVDASAMVQAQVVATPFYDPAGERQKAAATPETVEAPA